MTAFFSMKSKSAIALVVLGVLFNVNVGTFAQSSAEIESTLNTGSDASDAEFRAWAQQFEAGIDLTNSRINPSSVPNSVNSTGLYVTDLSAGHLLAASGIRRGDLIVEIGGTAVTSKSDFKRQIFDGVKAEKSAILIKVVREDRRFYVIVALR